MTNNQGSSKPEKDNTSLSLALEGVGEIVKKHLGKRSKVSEHLKGTPYWQPVRGILRWELREYYYEKGKRKSRVLETRRKKPRGI